VRRRTRRGIDEACAWPGAQAATTTHRPLFGAGAHTLTHVPIDRLGRRTLVSSATYSIVDMTESTGSSGRTIVASTAATIDGTATTLSAAAGRGEANAALLTVASSVGFTGGTKYLVSTVADSGDRELFTARRVDSGSMYAERELRGTYASASLVEGVEISGTFPSSVADDEDAALLEGREYQVTWSYTIAGEAYLVPERILVGRYSITPWVGAEDVLMGEPKLSRMISPHIVQEVIAVASEEISGELEASRVDPSYYRPTLAGRTAARYLCLSKLRATLGQESDREDSDMWRQRYKKQILQMIEGRPDGARIVSKVDDTVHGQGGVMDILVPA